jgi:hypothetical protein
MNLFDLIELLEKYPQEKRVPLGIGNPHSWRGDYCELAFEPVKDVTVGDMLASARSAMGATFQGYKGGDFPMTGFSVIHLEHKGDYSDNGTALKILFDLMCKGVP